MDVPNVTAIVIMDVDPFGSASSISCTAGSAGATSVDGAWCGVVDYEIPYADGRRSLPLVDQLLPFSVLRPQRTTRQ